MDGSVLGRISAARQRLSAPRSFKTTSVSATAVTLKWSAPKGAKPAYYVVLRDGKAIAKTTKPTYTDRKVKAGKTYRYAVRAYDKGKHAGAITKSLRVHGAEGAALGAVDEPGSGHRAGHEHAGGTGAGA